MKFSFRLTFYFFGFMVGCAMLFFIMNKKNARCSYFPNDRVLKNISSKPFYYSDIATKKIGEDWLDTIDVKNTLLYGDIDFSRSNKKIGSGKLYTISGKTTKNQALEVIIENYEDKAVLKDVIKL